VENDTLSYVAKIAIRNYGIVLLLLLLVCIASLYQGKSVELILLRMAIVPLVFLAPRGLVSIYRQPIVEHKLTIRGVEFVLLHALITSLSVFVLLWTSEATVSELVKTFLSIYIPLSLLFLVFMAIDIKKNKKDIQVGG